MLSFQGGRLLRIFVDENDSWHGQPLYVAIIETLRDRGIAGASAFRGVEGYGAHATIHKAKVFSLAPNLPIAIEAVDTEEKLAAVLPALTEMVSEGLVTLEEVEFARVRRG